MNEFWLSQTGDAEKSGQAGTLRIYRRKVLRSYKTKIKMSRLRQAMQRSLRRLDIVWTRKLLAKRFATSQKPLAGTTGLFCQFSNDTEIFLP